MRTMGSPTRKVAIFPDLFERYSMTLTHTPALINLIEVMLNLEYLYLRHFSSRSTRKGLVPGTKVARYHGHAPLVGFSSALMTLSKTVLYFLQGTLSELRSAQYVKRHG